MNAHVSKIVLSSSRDIPFNKLLLSQSNVRRIKAGETIEDLAESIARRGLIQSLHVRPVVDASGKETGMYEVPAGGRRYRALELLAKQKRLAKSAPVPCVVSDASSPILIDEVSLAENIERAPLHPLDQFRAFQAMRDKGMSEEAIAAAFVINVNVVKQRLRLASVSPALLELYASDEMTLEQLMAFSVTSDHERQIQVWNSVSNDWQKEPWRIRRLLTETTVRASDRRAVFVGLEAYEQAGGIVLRDLFQSDDGGWLQDVALLDRLTSEKLQSAANDIAAEGWKWVETAVSFPFGHAHGLRVLTGTPLETSSDEEATREALQAEYNQLSEDHDGVEELPDDVDQRMGELESALSALDDMPLSFTMEDMAIAGAFVSLNAQGALVVERGFVRAEDEPKIANNNNDDDAHHDDGDGHADHGNAQNGPVADDHVHDADGDDEADGIKPLPDRLMSELTAHRTLALRDAVASNPHVALTALLHRLVSGTFLRANASGALEASVRTVHFPAQAEDLADCPSAKSVDDRHQRWAGMIPNDEGALWTWLEDLDLEFRLELLAHCVSFGVNALYERANPYGAGISSHGLKQRFEQADRLARATGLDMAAAGWKPTVGNYLGRVTKARIVEAVREGAGERAAELIGHLKKGDMAREAERLLDGTGWLPEPLRKTDADTQSVDVGEMEGAEPSLPAFLSESSEDSEEAASDDEDMSYAVAAE